MAFSFNKLVRLSRQVGRVIRQLQRGTATTTPPRTHPPSRSTASGSSVVVDYPGDYTGSVTMIYDPIPGPEAGPGEVVWTWVPFEELDGRGKDRPVLIIGHSGKYLLALQLSTRDRNNQSSHDRRYLDIGSGPWDSQGRPSEVKLDRILQVNPRDMRRDGGLVSESVFKRVAQAMQHTN